MNKLMFFIIACVSFMQPVWAGETIPNMPMPVNYENSANHRWLNKKVHDSRLLDDMEDLATWTLENKVDDRGKGSMSLTKERYKDGGHSLRLHFKARSNEYLGVRGRPFGITIAGRRFASEDWSDFNRISFWVWPDFPGHRIISFMVSLENDGKEPGEALNEVYPLTSHFFLLKNNTWNHVVWEIPHIKRDKVTRILFKHRLQGNEPQASDTVTFDIDKLELQRVTADHYEGWNVALGQISFSHTGYQIGSPKSAIASDFTAKKFELIDQQTSKTVFSKAIETAEGRIGTFQVMDFSEFETPGRYTIKAGDVTTQPFSIDQDVWEGTIWKAINFFYSERCGMEIAGIHRVCHRDWYVVHGDKKIVINGGWHDAGDLCQVSMRTCEGAYAMFSLADKLRKTGRHPELANRLIEEAKWGLDWILKTSFHDGYRVSFALMGVWTNGIIGDEDDVPTEAVNDPYGNLKAAAVEAIAARILKDTDPELAEYSLAMAKEDYNFAMAELDKPCLKHKNYLDMISTSISTSLDMFDVTGQRHYADKALEQAQIIVDSQQKSLLPGLEVPLTGFFYKNPAEKMLMRQDIFWFRNSEHSLMVALARLCETFPDHKDWIQWYSAVALHTEYFLKEMSKFTYPYHVLPFSMYKVGENSSFRLNEYLAASGTREDIDEQRKSYRQQVLNGFKVGDGYYVRAFAVEPSLFVRGSFSPVLSKAKAISTAAHLRGSLDLNGLSQQQLHWIVGRNPFAQSTMCGEGYGYRPHYAAMSGDLVGSLAIGFKFRGDSDVPYWPASNAFHFTEMFVLPVYRWIWLMGDLAGPAIVEGQVKPKCKNIRFREITTGKESKIKPHYTSGKFRGILSAGRYKVLADGQKRTVTLLPAGVYKLDLRDGRVLDFDISHKTKSNGQVIIKVKARGSGSHSFAIRTDNLVVSETEEKVNLRAKKTQTITWKCKMKSADAPWVAVIVPDDDLSQREEAIGSISMKAH